MAYLNVRQRRLELELLYVGLPEAGKATSLRALTGAEPSTTEAITWASTPRTFDELEVVTRLRLADDALPEAGLAALIQEADAVVFVASAEPASLEQTRRALDACAGHLGGRPLILQWNKADLVPASAEVLAALAAERAVATVQSRALEGDGVVEAAEAALEAALKRARRQDEQSGAPPAGVDRHPLLGALREAMRATVASYVEGLEQQTTRAIAAQLEPIVKAQAALGAQLADVGTALGRARDERRALLGEIRQLGARTEVLQRQLDQLTTQHADVTIRAEEGLATTQRALSTLARREDITALGQRVLTQLDERGAQETSTTLGIGKSITTLGKHLEATRGAIEVAIQRESERSSVHLQEQMQRLSAIVVEPLGEVQATTGELRAVFEEIASDQQKKKGWFR